MLDSFPRILKFCKVSFASPECPKAQANKTGVNFMIFILYSWKIVFNSMLYMIFKYDYKQVLIQQFGSYFVRKIFNLKKLFCLMTFYQSINYMKKWILPQAIMAITTIIVLRYFKTNFPTPQNLKRNPSLVIFFFHVFLSFDFLVVLS